MTNATATSFLELTARALRASSIAGIWTVITGLLLCPVLFIAVLGLVPIVEPAFDIPIRLLRIPSGGSIFAVVAFWSMIIYFLVFSLHVRTKLALETERTTLQAHLVTGVLAILGVCAGIAYLIHEHATENRARATKALVLDFVQRNDAVMREVGGNGKAWLSSGAYDRDGSGRYDVSVTGGTRTIYAIVSASRDSPAPRLTLLCTTVVDLGRRVPGKHPCDQ